MARCVLLARKYVSSPCLGRAAACVTSGKAVRLLWCRGNSETSDAPLQISIPLLCRPHFVLSVCAKQKPSLTPWKPFLMKNNFSRRSP
eukprot:2446207-Pleurochrysis_carterae.AAC.4